MKRKIVLFIGAGFNYEIGLPIISTFGEASDKQYKGVSDHNTDNSREAAGMLVQAGDIFKEFQTYCKNASRFVNINCNNMEDIFCLAEILKQAGEQKIKLNNRDCKIEEIEESIKLWLWKIFQQCPPLTKKTDSKGREYALIFENSYKSLFEKIVSVSKNIGVITTNYDIVFEYGVYINKGYCGYPVESQTSELKSILENKKKYVKEEDEGSIVLCKLHGSVNFFSNGTDNITIFDDFIEEANKDNEIGKSVIKNMPTVFAFDAIWKIRENFVEKMIPEIIPPTYSKLENKPWLRGMWSKALDLLTHCEKLIFIGYGMPDSDGFMRSIIQSAMTKRENENDLQIYIIDPCQEVQERYRKLFAPMKQKVKNIKKKYTDSVDELKKLLS